MPTARLLSKKIPLQLSHAVSLWRRCTHIHIISVRMKRGLRSKPVLTAALQELYIA